jgi:hypothetical protein
MIIVKVLAFHNNLLKTIYSFCKLHGNHHTKQKSIVDTPKIIRNQNRLLVKVTLPQRKSVRRVERKKGTTIKLENQHQNSNS